MPYSLGEEPYQKIQQNTVNETPVFRCTKTTTESGLTEEELKRIFNLKKIV
jgi:hypothetical protein